MGISTANEAHACPPPAKRYILLLGIRTRFSLCPPRYSRILLIPARVRLAPLSRMPRTWPRHFPPRRWAPSRMGRAFPSPACWPLGLADSPSSPNQTRRALSLVSRAGTTCRRIRFRSECGTSCPSVRRLSKSMLHELGVVLFMTQSTISFQLAGVRGLLPP